VLSAVSYAVPHKGTFTITDGGSTLLVSGERVIVRYPASSVGNGQVVATSAPTPGQTTFNVGMAGLGLLICTVAGGVSVGMFLVVRRKRAG
jgi:hypothetical protein